MHAKESLRAMNPLQASYESGCRLRNAFKGSVLAWRPAGSLERPTDMGLPDPLVAMLKAHHQQQEQKRETACNLWRGDGLCVHVADRTAGEPEFRPSRVEAATGRRRRQQAPVA